MDQEETQPQIVSRGEVVEFAAEYIRNGIVTGQFAPGQRMISSELIEDIGISRGSLREAFSRLATEGLIDLVPNRGALVKRMTKKELINLFRIREVLEGLAARQAAEAILQGNNLKEYSDILEWTASNRQPLSSKIFTEKNSLFHSSLVAIADNKQLADLLNRLQIRVLMFMFGRALQPNDIEHSMHEHIPIAEAILLKNPDAAEAAMRKHLRGSCDRILQVSGTLLKRERTSRA
jgi:DNA-binding GntR family transcriptional regulator